MNGALEWINTASSGWWNYIVHTTWQAAVVGSLLLLLVHFLGRRWPAPLRYALLVLALLKFACPPLLPVPTGLFTHFTPPRVVLPTAQEGKPAQASDSQVLRSNPGVGFEQSPWTSFQSGHWHSPLDWTAWLMVCHLLGTGWVAVSVTSQAARLRALTRSARLIRGGRIPEQYRNLAIQLGLYRIPALAVSDDVDGPMAFGLKNAAILLPSKIVSGLAPGELRAVLAHELAHCQRGDLWLNWIQLILSAVWWFHPVLWLVNRSLREVREDCCDDLLLARGVISNDAYCDVLLRVAAEVTQPLPLKAALGLGQGLHPLGRRLTRIMDWTIRRSESVSMAGALAVLSAAALLFPGTRSGEMSAPPSQSLPASLDSARPKDVVSEGQQNHLSGLARLGKTGPSKTQRRMQTLANRPPEIRLPVEDGPSLPEPLSEDRTASFRQTPRTPATVSRGAVDFTQANPRPAMAGTAPVPGGPWGGHFYGTGSFMPLRSAPPRVRVIMPPNALNLHMARFAQLVWVHVRVFAFSPGPAQGLRSSDSQVRASNSI
jgi:beta-lactamase regulating signal transducer with metallopeptidase domain